MTPCGTTCPAHRPTEIDSGDSSSSKQSGSSPNEAAFAWKANCGTSTPPISTNTRTSKMRCHDAIMGATWEIDNQWQHKQLGYETSDDDKAFRELFGYGLGEIMNDQLVQAMGLSGRQNRILEELSEHLRRGSALPCPRIPSCGNASTDEFRGKVANIAISAQKSCCPNTHSSTLAQKTASRSAIPNPATPIRMQSTSTRTTTSCSRDRPVDNPKTRLYGPALP